MARKKRRRRARGRKGNPKKRVHRRRKRRAVANPRRTFRRRRRRTARANPRRRHRRRRARAANPGHFKRRRRAHGRGRRRNPAGLPPIMPAAIAVGAGVAAFGAVQAIGYFITKDQVAQGQRNRNIVGAAGAILGLFLMKKKPAIGLAVAAGSVLGAVGGWVTLKLLAMLPPKVAAPATAAVYAENMMNAVYAENMLNGMGGMNAVYADNMRALVPAMGDYQPIGDLGGEGLPPGPPWLQNTPFGPG